MNCCDANGKCKGGQGCPVGDMPVRYWPGYEDAEYWTEDTPAWWEIALAVVVMVIVIAVLIVSAWGSA